MALEDYKSDMEMCHKCSACKFIPLEKIKGYEYVNACPSISRYNFHAYSGGGRIAVALAMLSGRLEYSDKLLDMVYNCQMCGACDVSCKYAMDMEVLEPINEFRIRCVEEGRTVPALDKIMSSLRKQDTMVPGAKARRGHWSEGLDVKNYTDKESAVIFHAGCRTCFYKELWPVARAAVTLLQKAGVDVGIAGGNESCCGGRAYTMGYKDDLIRQARRNSELFKKSGAKILVTGCSECYQAFKVLYDKLGMPGGLKVLHITEYVDLLIKEGKLKPGRKVDMKVTYHDPCYLGRLGEPYIHWQGKRIPGHMYRFEPQKVYRRGTHGVYEPPRDILKSIPGLKLIEMDRRKEYAWCCGAGGGVKETNPEFSLWTAKERLREAESTGAESIVSACPGCELIFDASIRETGSNLKTYDVLTLLEKSI